MTYATATTNFCIAHCNLSATIDHYETHDNLCLTTKDTLAAYASLSTNIDHILCKQSIGTLDNLSPTTTYPF